MSEQDKPHPTLAEELGLTGPRIKERINSPYIIANQIITIQKAQLDMGNSTAVIEEAVQGLLAILPDTWKDEAFREAMKEASYERTVDKRPEFSGTKVSKEFCEAHGLVAEEKIQKIDYHKALQACINLLERRGMWGRKEYKEIMLGVPANDTSEEYNPSEQEETA